MFGLRKLATIGGIAALGTLAFAAPAMANTTPPPTKTVAATVTIGQSPPASGGQFPWETPAIVGGSLALAASIAGTTYVVRRNARQHGAER